MKKGLHCIPLLYVFFLCSVSVFGQTEKEIVGRFGAPIKSYLVSDNIYMTPQYTDDGQVWAMTLYFKRVEIGDKIKNSDKSVEVFGNQPLPWLELVQVLGKIIPKSERGKLKEIRNTTDAMRLTIYNYENVVIKFISFINEKDETIDIDLQIRGSDKQAQKTDESNRPDSLEAASQNSDEILSRVTRSVEFVRILWTNRNLSKK